MDAGSREYRGHSLERLAAVKPIDFWWLFVLTALVWAAILGGYIVVDLMQMRGE